MTLFDSPDPEFVPAHHARRNDPVTSFKAARRVKRRASSQVARIMAMFSVGDWTAEEVSKRAGVRNGWRRVSDAKNAGSITPTRLQRRSSEGEMQTVWSITDAGRTFVDSLEVPDE